MSDTKPFKVTVESRDGYFYARVEAEATSHELAPAYLAEILSEAGAAGFERVLIERKIPGGIATTLVFSQAGRLEELAKGMSVAIVDNDPSNFSHLERGIRFAEPQAVRLKAFQEIDAALDWLLADK